jgi:hypothetical protein
LALGRAGAIEVFISLLALEEIDAVLVAPGRIAALSSGTTPVHSCLSLLRDPFPGRARTMLVAEGGLLVPDESPVQEAPMWKRHLVLLLLPATVLGVPPSHSHAASFTLTKVVDKSTPIPDGTGTFGCLVGYSISGGRVAFWGSGFRPPFFCEPAGIYRFDGTALGKVADTHTDIPGGVGMFTRFGSPPLISGNTVVFEGFGSGGQHGIYAFDGTTLAKVVDTNTPIPGGNGNFSDFFSFAASGTRVAFFGSGSQPGGVYLFDGASLTKVADTKTPLPPGGVGNFSGFGSVAISGPDVVFDAVGESFGQEGIYRFDGMALTRIADTTMAMPEGTGNFIIFLSGAVVSDGTIAFKGLGPGFDEGIYAFDGSTLGKVVDRNTPIPDAKGTFYDFGLPVTSDGYVSFLGVSESQKQGLYLFDGSALTRVADTSTAVAGGAGTFARFSDPALSGRQVVFKGEGSLGEQGIYFSNGTTLSAVADDNTPIPAGPGTLIGFTSTPMISDNHVVFGARGSLGQEGIYAASRESIGPAKVWLGLRNSDDVGLRLDVLAQIFRNDVVVASGQLDDVSTGSSGFNNARLSSVTLSPSGTPVEFQPGDTVAMKVSVRRTCSGSGHNSGTVRFWYGGTPADSGKSRAPGSRFDASVAGADRDFFLGDSFRLDASPGSARRFVDAFVDSKAACPERRFTPLGTWTAVLP